MPSGKFRCVPVHSPSGWSDAHHPRGTPSTQLLDVVKTERGQVWIPESTETSAGAGCDYSELYGSVTSDETICISFIYVQQ